MRVLIVAATLAVALANPLAPGKLRAEGTNLLEPTVPAYALNSATPTLTWAPQHTDRGAVATGAGGRGGVTEDGGAGPAPAGGGCGGGPGAPAGARWACASRYE